MVPRAQMNRWENNSCLKVKYQSLFPWCTFLLYWLGSSASLFIHSNGGGGGGGSCSSLVRKMHRRVRERTKMFKTIWICVTGRSKMGGHWCWGAWGPLEENVSHSFVSLSFFSWSCLISSWISIDFLPLYPSISLSIFGISLPLRLSNHAHSVEYDVIIMSHQLADNTWVMCPWVSV